VIIFPETCVSTFVVSAFTLGGPNAPLISGAALLVLALATTAIGADASLAVYLLSFWHYFLYWLAFVYRTVTPAVFRRDAILAKTAALLALAFAYLGEPLDYVSLAIVATGFLLNCAAAHALGTARTYYGHEIAGMPHMRITSFPYTWISHPMLIGNIAAYGGTLMNESFRQQWWPLACAHVIFNLGLLVMELRVKPRTRITASAPVQRRISRPVFLAAVAVAVAVAGAAAGALLDTVYRPANLLVWISALLGAVVLIHAFVTFCSYSSPTICGIQRSQDE